MICQEEARWASQLKDEGKSIEQIKSAIDARFS